MAARGVRALYDPLLSGLITCQACGFQLTGYPRNALPPYPDGTPKREYRCRPRPDYPETANACGRNHIDGRAADVAVATAIRARLADPRRADRVAENLARVGEQRARIEADIARWDATANDLVTKTATWGVDRVDTAMTPILREINNLPELAVLDEPDTAQATAADAVATWDEAVERGDIPAQRALIRKAFPNLGLAMPARWGDHDPERFIWDRDPSPHAGGSQRRRGRRPSTQMTL